ncbi:hypothetical protein KGY73_00955 [bacterium]|nr:hypothetical protein [bacterium]
MQKIEKWRIKELALILNQLVQLLKAGNNQEWASVFSHYYHETQQIIHKDHFDWETLRKLVQNIKNCFEGAYSFSGLVLCEEDSGEIKELNKEFFQKRARLFEILLHMEEQGSVYVH